MTHDLDPRVWPTIITHEIDPRELPTRLTQKNYLWVWPTRGTRKKYPQILPISLNHKTVLTDENYPWDPYDLANSQIVFKNITALETRSELTKVENYLKIAWR